MATIIHGGGAVIDGRAWLDLMIGQKIIASNSAGNTSALTVVGIIDFSEVSKITVKLTNGASRTDWGDATLWTGASIANGKITGHSGSTAVVHSSSNQVFDLTKLAKEDLKSCAFSCSSTSSGSSYTELQFISYE